MPGIITNNNPVAYKGSFKVLKDTLPLIGGVGAIGLGAYDVYKAKPEHKKEHAIRNTFIILLATLLLGMICKKWVKAHPLVNKFLNNTEPAMEHIVVHTTPEASHIISKSAALQKIFNNSAGKSSAELQALVKKALPMEAETLMPRLFSKYASEAEVLGSRLEAELPFIESKLPGLFEAKIPFLESAANRFVASMVAERESQLARMGKKLFTRA